MTGDPREAAILADEDARNRRLLKESTPPLDTVQPAGYGEHMSDNAKPYGDQFADHDDYLKSAADDDWDGLTQWRANGYRPGSAPDPHDPRI